MRKSSNGSSHAGFNNRPRQEGAGKWKSNGEKSIQVKHRSPYLRPPLTSFPIPPRLFLFVTLSLLELPPSNAPYIHPSWSYLYQQPSVFPYSVSRFDATRLSTYVSPRVSLRPSLLCYSSHVFSFFPFFSLLRINQYLFPIQSIILKHPWFNRLI